MITYFVMFLIPALISINNKTTNNNILWFILGMVFSIIIGLRFEVGGDWITYLNHFLDIKYYTYFEVLQKPDPGYFLLNSFAYDLNLGIGGVNFICATIFMYGLIKFAKQEDNPWMVIAVAVPYTIIVVSMGYTRQAVALGFILWSLVYLRQNKMLGFFIFVIIAVGFIGFGVWSAFLSQFQDSLIQNYVTAQMQSSGAYIRTFMNLIPSILLILYRKRWKMLSDDYSFWFIIALLSILSFAMVGFASTAIDRIALYLIPVQLVVFGRLGTIMSDQFSMSMINLLIVSYYSLVLFVWLNFATHAFAWIPYKNILFLNLL